MFDFILRLGLGELISKLIQEHVPGADEETVADIMEGLLPTPAEMPLQVDAEELRGVLQDDAILFEERQKAALQPGPEAAAQEQEIAEEVQKLRRRVQAKKEAIRKTTHSGSPHGPGASAAAGGASAAAGGAPPAPQESAEKGQHWQGKGHVSWQSEAGTQHLLLVHVLLSQVSVLAPTLHHPATSVRKYSVSCHRSTNAQAMLIRIAGPSAVRDSMWLGAPSLSMAARTVL